MPTLTLKGLPDHVYRALKERAVANRRSLNSEVIVSLERAVAAPSIDAAAMLARADAVRERIRAELDRRGLPEFTEEQTTAAKDEGRP